VRTSCSIITLLFVFGVGSELPVQFIDHLLTVRFNSLINGSRNRISAAVCRRLLGRPVSENQQHNLFLDFYLTSLPNLLL
jgi:hypothetical protein